MSDTSWKAVTVSSNEAHAVPNGDMAAHKLSDACWCGPRLDRVGAGIVVAHNALDGRESQDKNRRPSS